MKNIHKIIIWIADVSIFLKKPMYFPRMISAVSKTIWKKISKADLFVLVSLTSEQKVFL